MSEIQKEQEEEKLHQFILGLDDSISSMVTFQILIMDPSPSVNQAYSTIILEEC